MTGMGEGYSDSVHLVFWASGCSPSDADHLDAGDLGEAGPLSVDAHRAGAEIGWAAGWALRHRGRTGEGGAEAQNRTGDTGFFRPVLYQLSYLGT
jgi:hypothetical protein